MSGIAIVCGACLLGGLFLVAGFYVLDGRGGELGNSTNSVEY